MKLLYNFFIWLTEKVGLPIAGLFSSKLKKFTSGRKGLFLQIASTEVSKHQVIWFHAASLGEYEQGLPIMEAVKQRYPNYKLLVTFFSPSGYEVKKNKTFIAKEGNIFQEEINVADKAPVDEIKMNDLTKEQAKKSENKPERKKFILVISSTDN